MNRDYYVVFQKSDSKELNRPWRCLTWNNFDHVWLFHPHLEGALKINPLSNRIIIDYFPESLKEVLLFYKKHQHVIDIIKIKLPLGVTLGYSLRGIITCVSIIKAVLGIGAWFVITPQQLRRHLLKIGGRSLI